MMGDRQGDVKATLSSPACRVGRLEVEDRSQKRRDQGARDNADDKRRPERGQYRG